MARGLNKVMIIGHLGRDPEMRFTTSGRPVASFSVAATRGWTNNEGERQEETEWFHVVTWGGLAELCKKRLYKGSQVYVEGRLQTRCWEGVDGERHYRTELVAQEIIFLNSSDGGSESEEDSFTDEDVEQSTSFFQGDEP